VNRKTGWLLLVAAMLSVAFLYWVTRRPGLPGGREPSGPFVRAREAAPIKTLPQIETPPPAQMTRVTLFFPSSEDGQLRPEERDVTKPSDAVGFVRQLMREEAAGPKTPGLVAALPPNFSLRGAFVPGDGLVVADFNVDPAWAKAVGSNEEQVAVAAIVNTILQNLAQTDRVKILVNGNTVETLAGHVDISRALPAMKEIVGPAAAPATP
jgi:hypothetical protein